MLNEKQLQDLINWGRSGKRSVKIELDNYSGSEEKEISIWVYDFDLMAGQHVKGDVSEIDLLQRKKEELESNIKRLERMIEEEEGGN